MNTGVEKQKETFEDIYSKSNSWSDWDDTEPPNQLST